MQKIRALFELTRPLNCLITFVSIWVGAVIAGEAFITYRIFFAALSGALIAAYGNIINDIFDIEVDKINKPYRPLARGTITRFDARSAALKFAVMGLLLSFLVHPAAAAITLAAIVALYAYTPVFKGRSYAGNMLVAAVSSMAFVVGGLAVGRPWGASGLVTFAFLLHLGREIIKDIQDRDADVAAGYNTGAIYFDSRLSRVFAVGVLGALMAATVAPYTSGLYRMGYLLTVLFGVDLIVAMAIVTIIATDDSAVMRRVAAWLKVAMPLGILAMLLGAMGW